MIIQEYRCHCHRFGLKLDENSNNNDNNNNKVKSSHKVLSQNAETVQKKKHQAI